MKALFFLSIVFVSVNLFSQSNEQLIEETISKYESHTNVSYDIEYMMKFFDAGEPVYINSSVFIEKNSLDTVFGSKFIYNRTDSIIKYYKAPYIYIINLGEGKIRRSDASQGQTSFITGNIDGGVLDIYFTDIEELRRNLNNPENKIDYSDTLNFMKVKISYPDDGDFYDWEESVYINKTDKTINKIALQVKYYDQIQQNVWQMSNMKFDQLKDSDFEERVGKYLDAFEIEDYKPLTEEDYKLLDDGSSAPKIYGIIFPDYEKTLELNIDKITILDFWYTSCMPCIKVIPHLNDLKEKYKDKVEIIGVNPFEYKEEKKEKIYSFLKRTPINYTIFLVEKIPSEYNVRAYPTLYVVDKVGKVKYSQIGLSENTYEDLDKILNELLNGE